MARFTHPAIGSSGSSDTGTWQIEGGTLETQPAFDGDPLFSGGWTRLDNLVNFAIDVDMDNITNFGTGQYYMKLPFPSKYNLLLSNGCIHDQSTGREYAILGHVLAGTDTMTLLTTDSNGRQEPFTSSVPFALNALDNFHITGTYEAIAQ